MIVLDTDHLSCLEWGSQESAILRNRLAETPDRKIVVSIISYEEQMRGWMGLLATSSIIQRFRAFGLKTGRSKSAGKSYAARSRKTPDSNHTRLRSVPDYAAFCRIV